MRKKWLTIGSWLVLLSVTLVTAQEQGQIRSKAEIAKWIQYLQTTRQQVQQRANQLRILGRALSPAEQQKVQRLLHRERLLHKAVSFLKQKMEQAPTGLVMFSAKEVKALAKIHAFVKKVRQELKPRPASKQASKEQHALYLQLQARACHIRSQLLKLEAQRLRLLMARKKLQAELKTLEQQQPRGQQTRGSEVSKSRTATSKLVMGQPYLQYIKPHLVLATRHYGSYRDLGQSFQRLSQWARQHHVPLSSVAMCTFLKYPPKYQGRELLTEVAFKIKPLPRRLPYAQNYYIKKTKAVRAAVLHVKGPYQYAYQGTQRLTRWIKKTGLYICGPTRHYYLDDPSKVAAANCRTVVCIPVKAKRYFHPQRRTQHYRRHSSQSK